MSTFIAWLIFRVIPQSSMTFHIFCYIFAIYSKKFWGSQNIQSNFILDVSFYYYIASKNKLYTKTLLKEIN